MLEIEKNPGLYVTSEPWKLGLKNNPGLLVVDVFASSADNYTQPEFLERLRKQWERTIHVSTYVEYVPKGDYIPVDTHRKDRCDCVCADGEDHRKNYHLWRNTPEKVARIQEAGHCRRDYYWGGGDGLSKIWFDHCVNAEDIKALEDEGWTIERD